MPHRSIVILSVSAGAGHMRAAAALQAAFREDHPDCEVIILDTFKYTSPFLEKLILGAYMEVLKYSPGVYGYIYSRSEKGSLSGYAKSEFSRLVSKFSAVRLQRFLDRHNPGAVICTHPFPLGVLSDLRRRGEYGYFTAAAVTDFIIHPFWVFPGIDLYLVGAGQLVGDLVGYGISGESVRATGIPIDPVFASPVDRRAVLCGYGLDPDLPTALIMGGGLGLGPLADSVRALGSIRRRLQTIVVTGNNSDLRERIAQMAPGLANPVLALGYVDNINELMTSSDLLVSKAGGLSCAEALATGLPLFILDPLPGQEQRNSRFLVSAGAAVELNGVDDLVEKISSSLDQPAKLQEMSAAASRLGRPNAAREAAGLILEKISDYYNQVM